MLLIYLLLSGCSDVGIVTVTCTHSYVTDGTEDNGTFPGFTTDCDGWAESGHQSMASTQAECEQAGLDEGADQATCVCEVDTGACTFPGGVND